jgi:hypothetical protein
MTLYFLQSYTFFLYVNKNLKNFLNRYKLSTRSRKLHTTRRLGAVAAYTKRCAAHGILNSHRPFMRDTAAIAPNRKLYAVQFVLFVMSFRD